MSGYSGQDYSQLERREIISGRRNENVLTAKLLANEVRDPTSERRIVEMLSEAAVAGSVEARAKLCLYVGLDIQNIDFINQIVNGKTGDKTLQFKKELLDLALQSYDDDVAGYTAYSAIAGFYPPPSPEQIIELIDPTIIS